MAKGLDLTTAMGYILADTTLESGITNTYNDAIILQLQSNDQHHTIYLTGINYLLNYMAVKLSRYLRWKFGFTDTYVAVLTLNICFLNDAVMRRMSACQMC